MEQIIMKAGITAIQLEINFIINLLLKMLEMQQHFTEKYWLKVQTKILQLLQYVHL